MHTPPRLETRRLVLKLPHLGDAPSIARSYAADPEVTRYLSWRPHSRLDETHAFLRDLLRRERAGHCHPWLLTSRDGGEVLGMVEARKMPEGWELGYVLARAAWNRGLMTEAVGGVLPALSGLGLERIFADTHRDHVASQRVLEKNGFARHGIVPRNALRPNVSPEPTDSLRYVKGL